MPADTIPHPLKAPADLVAALKKNKKAKATFDGFSASHLRECIEWMAEGKSRNWKYVK